MSDYYDMDGKPITLMEWAQGFDGDRKLGSDEIGDVHVSTVHLGIDHSTFGGPPLIFETMIFNGEHDQEQWRYSTRDDALAGHARAVALVKGEA